MTDKSIPSPASTPASSNASVERPATVDSVMALVDQLDSAVREHRFYEAKAIVRAEVSRLATGRPPISYRERASAIPDEILGAGVQAAKNVDTRVTAGGVQAAFIKMSELLAALPAAPGAAATTSKD